MFSKLKAAWSRLGGGSKGGDPAGRPSLPLSTTATASGRPPTARTGVYQTAGIIEKDAPDGVKEHRFIRADTHQSKEDAVAFAISKAKQIIDLQGDRMFARD